MMRMELEAIVHVLLLFVPFLPLLNAWMPSCRSTTTALLSPYTATALNLATEHANPKSQESSVCAASPEHALTTNDNDVPAGHGLYQPFAQAVWEQCKATGWFEQDDKNNKGHAETRRLAVAKGFPAGSRVRMTVRSMPAKPDAPVAYARYALLETLVASKDDDSVSSPSSPSSPPLQHEGIQVLNAVIIPRIDSTWPVWGADFVALPGNKHLLLLDAQPMVANDTQHEHFGDWYNRYDIADTWPWAGNLPPEVQPYVSPRALWTRLGGTNSTRNAVPSTQQQQQQQQQQDSPTIKIAQQLLPVMEAHLQAYLQLVATSPNDETANRENWLRPYLEYRLAKDPARPMLQALYGKEWTEQILESVLFPMDLLFSNDKKQE